MEPVKTEMVAPPVLVTFTVLAPLEVNRLPPVAVVKTVPVPVTLSTPEAPNANVLVFDTAEENAAAETV